MKNQNNILNRSLLLAGSLLFLSGALSLKAGVDTWSGAGGTANWSLAANWAVTSSNTPPITGDTPAFGLVGSGGATLNNDISGGSYFGLTFNSGAPSFTLNGSSITTTGGIADNSANLETVNLPIILSGASHSVNAIAGGSMVINGVISDGGGVLGINKTGGGTVTLTGAGAGASTYTGATAVNAGTLALDFTTGGSTPVANIVSSSSPLSMGGGTLNINGSGSAASGQTFNGTTVAFGGSAISAASISGAGADNPTVALGAFTYAAGGAVEFAGPAYNNAVTTATGQAAGGQQAATATVTTTSGVANVALYSSATGVSGGTGNAAEATFATVGLYDFAIVTGTSPFTVAGASQGTGGTSGDGAYTLVNAANMPTTTAIPGLMIDALGTVSGHNSTYLAGIRFNAPGANLTSSSSALSVGALLVTPNVGANNVTLAGSIGLQPGFRSGSNPGSTVFWQNNVNGFLSITGTGGLGNDGKNATGLNSSFVQAGPGTVNYTVTDYYTGPTYLDGGVAYISTAAAGDAAFGAAATAAAVNLNGGTIMAGATFALDNAGANPRPLTLGNNGGGLAAATGNTLTVDGLVSGSGALIIGIPASSANGNVVGQVPGTGTGTANTTAVNANGKVALTGTANTYSGGTVIYNTALSFITGALGTGGLTINGGTLQWGGSTTTDISAQTVTINSAGATLDVNGNTVTLANSIGNGGSGALTVQSTAPGGVLNLSGAGTYTGITTVSGGTLNVNNTLASGSVSVANGAGFGGTGTSSTSVNWQAGSMGSFTSGSALTVGVVTLNNNAVTVNVPGGTPLGAGSYTLMNYTAAGSSGSFSTSAPTYTGAGAAVGTASSISTGGGVVTLTVTSTGVAGTWTNDVDGNWSAGVNWSSNPSVPHAAGDTAVLGVGTSLRTVTLDANEAVGGLTLTNANSFVIASSGKALTLDDKGFGAMINAAAGTSNAVQTSVALNDNATVTVSGGQSLAFAGTVSNNPGVNKTLTFDGSGTNILSAANTYGPASAGSAGTTLGGGGILQLGNSSALGAGDLTVTANSTLQSGAAGLSIANNIGIASGVTATVDNNGNALALGGVISGSGGLSKINNGTLTLGVNNTYTGITTIGGGTISITTDGASAGNPANLGAVPSSATANNVILNGGDLLGNGTFALNVNRGIGLGPISGSTPGTGLIDAASGQTFTVNGAIASAGNTGANSLTVNSGAGNNGMVVLAGANSFKGTTVITAGTLQLGNPLALQNSTLNYSSGTLDFGTQTAPLLGGLSGSQSLTLLNDSSAAVALTAGTNNASTAYSGGLSGTGASLTKSGSGTLDLTGNNTYTGATTVNAGTLQLGTGGVLGGSSLNLGNPTLGTAGTFHLTGGTINTGGLNLNTTGNTGGSTGLATFDSGSATFTGATIGGNQNGGEILITGGTISLGAIVDRRDASAGNGVATLNAGVVIEGGTVTASSVIISSLNSGGNMTISNGSLTIGNSSTTGGFEVGTGSSTARGGFLTVGGGALTYNGTDGLLLNTVSTCEGVAAFNGGISTLTGITLNPPGNTGGNASLTIGGSAVVYLGSVGIVTNSGAATATINLSGGTLGAVADWSSTAPMFLIGTNTFQAADASGNPFDITLTGVLGGNTNSAIIKTGSGMLTLSGGNYFTNGATVNAGTLNINGINALGGAYYGGLTLNGGTLQYSTNSTGNGSLDLTSIGTAGLTLGTGADVIDVNGNAVAYAGSIGNGGSGGLAVQSAIPGGVLNLSNNNNYLGNTLVGNGATLWANNTNGSATAGGTVTVASGGTLGGGGIISGAVEIQGGGILAPGNNSVGTNTIGALTLDSGAVGNFEFNGTANDRVVATGGLTVNGGAFNLYSAGSTAPWSTIGTFKLIQYSGADPVLNSSWTAASSSNPHVANPQTSLLYSFHASSGVLTLTIGLSGSAVSGTWTNNADGNWSVAANWDSNPQVPHSSGDLATFGAGSALRTVTLNAIETVGTMSMNNDNSFVIANGGKTLILDNNGSGANVFVSAGTANLIQAPVSLNDNVTATVNNGKSLAVSGNVGNASGISRILTVNGSGTLALSGNNTYGPAAGSTGTILSSGALQVGSNTALGAGDVSVANNGTLQAGATGLSIHNNIDIAPVATATVDTSGNNLTLAGTITDSGGLTKIGNGTLTISSASYYSGNTTVNGGVLSIPSYESVQYSTMLILNGGDLLGNNSTTLAPDFYTPIGIGPAAGSIPGTAFIDAASGQVFTLYDAITTAGNTGANNLVVNSGAGNNGTVYLDNDGNTFNGTTTISNGWLDVASPLSLQNSTVNYNNQGGVLVFDGDQGITAATLGGLAGAQNLGLTNLAGSGVSLTVGNNNGSTTYSGNLTDDGLGGGLTKVGTGTLTMSGTNSYNLATTISAGVLQLNTNGVLNSLADNVASVGGAGLTVSGGFLTATNTSNIGVPSAGLRVSSGSATFLGGLTTTPGSANGYLISVTGGSLTATNLSLGRTGLSDTTQPTAGSTTDGLYINGGTVNVLANLNMATSSSANSTVNTRIDSGSLTVGGALTIGLNNSGRWSVLDVNGGSLMVTNTTTGISVGGPLAGNAELLVRAGTVTAGMIGMGQAATGSTNMTAVINITNGSLYVGSGGIAQVSTGAVFTSTITLNGGTLGAIANWASTNNMVLGGAVIRTADTNGNPWNIALSGVLSGTKLAKIGAGILTLSGPNTYNGATTISNGTLALVAPGLITNTPQVSIAAGATFDASALAGYTFAGANPVQTLAGISTNGAGNVNVTGNALILASGAKALMQAAGGASPTVGKISVAGGLTLNNNTITVNVGGGILGTGSYRLLDCTGNLSGTANATPAFTGLGATPGAAVSISTTTGSAGHVDLTVSKATPLLQSALASNITTGQELSNSVLTVVFTNSAGTVVPGTAAFTSPGTVPPVGTSSQQVLFTPTDTADYNTVTFNVNVTVVSSVLIPTQSAGITGFSLVNGNVVISGTNGESGGTYYLLATTNLALPLSQWPVVATNIVSTSGGNGTFSFTGTNVAGPGAVQQYYILSSTNN